MPCRRPGWRIAALGYTILQLRTFPVWDLLKKLLQTERLSGWVFGSWGRRWGVTTTAIHLTCYLPDLHLDFNVISKYQDRTTAKHSLATCTYLIHNCNGIIMHNIFPLRVCNTYFFLFFCLFNNNIINIIIINNISLTRRQKRGKTTTIRRFPKGLPTDLLKVFS